ncbi:MAG: hypothetical protein M1823_000008 [Watsoniomyces obsoletus]|nr:MAG: hypothetical protein M1823_000008 [Watsoniomyces obsoletus]
MTWISTTFSIFIGLLALVTTTVQQQFAESDRQYKDVNGFLFAACRKGPSNFERCRTLWEPGYYSFETKPADGIMLSRYHMQRDMFRNTDNGAVWNTCCAQFCANGKPLGGVICGTTSGQVPGRGPPEAVSISCESSPSCENPEDPKRRQSQRQQWMKSIKLTGRTT